MTWVKGDLAGLTPTPWKNGGGATRELVCEPANARADDFVWRVSVADVTEDGPFSIFPGVQRVIVSLFGDGFELRFADGTRHSVSKPYVPFGFAGDAAVSAHLLGGACLDFNLMVRTADAKGDVEVVRVLGRHALHAPIAFAMVVRGTVWLTTPDHSEPMTVGEFIYRDITEHDIKNDAWVDVTSDAVVLMVKITLE